MKLQVAVIFTSLQNAKFTSIAGYAISRPTFIESFMTIFGQCINVLNYNMGYGSARDCDVIQNGGQDGLMLFLTSYLDI